MTRLVRLIIFGIVSSIFTACGSDGSGSDPEAIPRNSSSASSTNFSRSSAESVPASSSLDSSSSIAVDDVADQLEFGDVVDANYGEWVIFGPFIIKGVNRDIEASIAGGEIALEDLPFSSTNIRLTNGQSISIRLKTDNLSLSRSTAQLILGEQPYEFAATTRADTEAPLGKITFPIGNASTNQNEISVSGTASDNEGIFNVSVNGVPAVSDNDFETWTAKISLNSGLNDIKVSVLDVASNSSNQVITAKIDRQPTLNRPEGLVVDRSSELTYLVDSDTKSIYSVNKSGLRKLISGSKKGTGEAFRAIDRIALGLSNQFLYVSDSRNDLIFQINIENGNRTIISSDTVGNGSNYRLPNGLVAESGSSLLIVDALNSRIVRTNIKSGDNFEVSGSQVGLGERLQQPRDIALSDNKKTAYVTDLDRKAILSIDLTTGNRQIISSENVGSGEELTQPESIVVNHASNRLFVTNWSKVIAIDLDTGDRQLLSSFARGKGAEPGIYWDLELLGSEGIVVSDVDNEMLVLINTDTGDRSIYTQKSGSYASSWVQPEGIAISRSDSAIIVSDPGLGKVVNLDLSNQQTTVILDKSSENFSPNMPINRFAYDALNERFYFAANLFSKVVAFEPPNPIGRTIFDEELTEEYLGIIGSIVVSPERSYLYYSARDAASIYQVNIETGERTAIASPSVGSGLEIHRPVDLFMDDINNQIFALSDSAETLFLINIETQEREVITSYPFEVGSGVRLSGSHIFDVDLNKQLAWIITFSSDNIYEIDLSTGSRKLISSLENNPGLSVSYPEDVAYSSLTDSLFITTPNDGYIIQVDRFTGDRALLFP